MIPRQLPPAWKEAYEERAAIKEFCANMPRDQAEEEALAEVIELMKHRREKQ